MLRLKSKSNRKAEEIFRNALFMCAITALALAMANHPAHAQSSWGSEVRESDLPGTIDSVNPGYESGAYSRDSNRGSRTRGSVADELEDYGYGLDENDDYQGMNELESLEDRLRGQDRYSEENIDSFDTRGALGRAKRLRKERLEAEAKNEALVNERLEEARLKAEKELFEDILSATKQRRKEAQARQSEARREAARLNALKRKERRLQQRRLYERELRALREAQREAERAKLEAERINAEARRYQPQAQRAYQDQVSTLQSQSVDTRASKKTTLERISIYPLVGVPIAGMQDKFYDITGQGSFGAGFSYDMIEGFVLGFNYLYSGYEISNFQFENYEYNQHNLELFAHYKFLHPKSRIRPYVGAGLNYSTGDLRSSYDNDIYGAYYGYSGFGAQDQEIGINSLGGSLQGGVNFEFTKNFSAGAGITYLIPLSTDVGQNNDPFGYNSFNNSFSSPFEMQRIADDLGDTNFLNLLATVRYTF